MKKIKKSKMGIYIIALIGMIFYIILTPITLKADGVSQNDVTTKNHFDMTLFYWGIGVVGGCIALTLIYVGFKKYKGEQKEKKRKIKNTTDKTG